MQAVPTLAALAKQEPRRGMYEANRLFLERMHRRRELVPRPEQAALFYVPVLFTQMHGCLCAPEPVPLRSQ